MKKIIGLLFMMGIALTAFTQTKQYEYRTGIKIKKQSFKSPVIRLGVLSDSIFDVSGKIVESTMLDTQAIYVVNVELDTNYIVVDLDSVALGTTVDTFQKIGNTIYNLGIEKELESDYDNKEIIVSYWDDFEASSAIDQEIVMPSDTQTFYLITEIVDSVMVVNELSNFEDFMLVDGGEIDTFYQVGPAILQADLTSSIEVEDWEIIRKEVLVDPIINDDLDEMSYEEYLDLQTDQTEVTFQEEAPFVVQPIILKEEVNTTKVDTILKIEKEFLPVDMASETSVSTIDKTTSKTNNDLNAEMVNNRLIEMEQQLVALRKEQAQSLERDEQPPVLVESRLATVSSEDMIELEMKIKYLEAQAENKRDPELERMRQELSNYERQNRVQEQRELQNRVIENQTLRLEIETLRNQINTQQQQQVLDTNLVQIMVTENPQEMSQLRTEVDFINENMEMMKQLLLQQKTIEALKSESAPAPVSNNTSEVELIELRQQLASIQQDLKQLKEVKPASTPIVERVIVEAPTPAPLPAPVNVSDKIRGREKQIVFFKIGSSKLSEEAIFHTSSIAQLMLEYQTLDVVLEAHTDPSGDATKNLLLSKKRAESVKEFLLRYGISANRIFLDFRGEDSQSDPAFGRRVEMRLKVK